MNNSDVNDYETIVEDDQTLNIDHHFPKEPRISLQVHSNSSHFFEKRNEFLKNKFSSKEQLTSLNESEYPEDEFPLFFTPENDEPEIQTNNNNYSTCIISQSSRRETKVTKNESIRSTENLNKSLSNSQFCENFRALSVCNQKSQYFFQKKLKLNLHGKLTDDTFSEALEKNQRTETFSNCSTKKSTDIFKTKLGSIKSSIITHKKFSDEASDQFNTDEFNTKCTKPVEDFYPSSSSGFGRLRKVGDPKISTKNFSNCRSTTVSIKLDDAKYDKDDFNSFDGVTSALFKEHKKEEKKDKRENCAKIRRNFYSQYSATSQTSCENQNVSKFLLKRLPLSSILSEEHEKILSTVTRFRSKTAKIPENFALNRYIDSIPYDYNRVKLQGTLVKKDTDYINASQIYRSDDSYRYIVSQYPDRRSAESFYELIYENKVEVVIMLDNYETFFGSSKNDTYVFIPSKKPLQFEKFKITFHSKSSKGPIELYKVNIILEGQSSKTRVLIYSINNFYNCEKKLPINHIINLQLTMETLYTRSQSPSLVCCNDGTNSSCLFVSADIIRNDIFNDGYFDIFRTVSFMRYMRKNSINNLALYKWLHIFVEAMCKSYPNLFKNY